MRWPAPGAPIHQRELSWPAALATAAQAVRARGSGHAARSSRRQRSASHLGQPDQQCALLHQRLPAARRRRRLELQQLLHVASRGNGALQRVELGQDLRTSRGAVSAGRCQHAHVARNPQQPAAARSSPPAARPAGAGRPAAGPAPSTGAAACAPAARGCTAPAAGPAAERPAASCRPAEPGWRRRLRVRGRQGHCSRAQPAAQGV